MNAMPSLTFLMQMIDFVFRLTIYFNIQCNIEFVDVPNIETPQKSMLKKWWNRDDEKNLTAAGWICIC